MHYRKSFLTRFMTTRCFIFVFILNCAMAAEAGMLLGKVCFHDIETTVKPVIESNFIEEEGKIKIVEIEQPDFFTISEGKLKKETRYKTYCTIKKADCDKENCPQGVLQLMRWQQSKPPCYNYKVFISPGKYHITCGKCETEPPLINYGSLQWDINFCHSGDKCFPCNEPLQ